MFALLKFILVFFLVIVLIALFFVVALVTGVLSLFHKAKPTQRSNSRTYSSTSGTNSQGSTNYQQPTGGQQKKKIIPQDEGEYVDFEEVK